MPGDAPALSTPAIVLARGELRRGRSGGDAVRARHRAGVRPGPQRAQEPAPLCRRAGSGRGRHRRASRTAGRRDDDARELRGGRRRSCGAGDRRRREWRTPLTPPSWSPSSARPGRPNPPSTTGWSRCWTGWPPAPRRAERLRVFELGLLRALGFQPVVDRCAACGSAERRSSFRWDPDRGGAVCSACARGGGRSAVETRAALTQLAPFVAGRRRTPSPCRRT